MKPLLFILLTVGTIFTATMQLAQDAPLAPFALQVDVALVSVDATVHDSEGKPVNTLTREDFALYEDGVLQEIQHFEAMEARYSVLLLFDVSGSTAAKMPFLLEAANRFLEGLRPQDQVAIAMFDDRVTKIMDWRTRGGVRQQVPISPSRGGTDLYGALQWTARETSGIPGRKGVIVLTDGVDNRLGGGPIGLNEGREFRQALDAVEKSRTQFYFVAINTDLNPDLPRMVPSAAPRDRMEKVAARTGGSVFFPKSIEDVAPLYTDIARQFAASYTFAYRSTRSVQDGTYRRIEVRLVNPKADLRISQSRMGYYANGANNEPKAQEPVVAVSKTSGLEAPALITPIAQAILSDEWHFTWSGVPSAVRYQLVVNAPSQPAPVLELETRVPRYSLAKSAIPKATQDFSGWTWKVRARTTNGEWGLWSELRPFDIFVP